MSFLTAFLIILSTWLYKLRIKGAACMANFRGENFCGFCSFLANRESFPLESFAVYGT